MWWVSTYHFSHIWWPIESFNYFIESIVCPVFYVVHIVASVSVVRLCGIQCLVHSACVLTVSCSIVLDCLY